MEQEGVNFESNNSEHYNRPFTLQELQYNIGHTKNTAPEDDGTHYLMLNRVPEVAKEYMCKIFNKMWQQSYFPDEWNTAIVIPIHKPCKNHTDSRNYRPIALTSCICKLFERIINARLVDYLEMNKIFTNIQCGCRQNRSTLDHLVRLEHEVRKAFVLSEDQVSIFFDLEKAYDMTWRGGILRDLETAGLKCYLPKYIEQFLGNRYFKVRLENYI